MYEHKFITLLNEWARDKCSNYQISENVIKSGEIFVVNMMVKKFQACNLPIKISTIVYCIIVEMMEHNELYGLSVFQVIVYDFFIYSWNNRKDQEDIYEFTAQMFYDFALNSMGFYDFNFPISSEYREDLLKRTCKIKEQRLYNTKDFWEDAIIRGKSI